MFVKMVHAPCKPYCLVGYSGRLPSKSPPLQPHLQKQGNMCARHNIPHLELKSIITSATSCASMRPEESATKSDIAVAAKLAWVLRETHFERRKSQELRILHVRQHCEHLIPSLIELNMEVHLREKGKMRRAVRRVVYMAAAVPPLPTPTPLALSQIHRLLVA